MKSTQIKTAKRLRRHVKIRARVSGSAQTPRLAVFKSNKYVYAQLIDDQKGVTIAACSSLQMKDKKAGFAEKAKLVGVEIAKIAGTKKITKAVFDRGGFLYRGAIKAIADGAREGGLVF